MSKEPMENCPSCGCNYVKRPHRIGVVPDYYSMDYDIYCEHKTLSDCGLKQVKISITFPEETERVLWNVLKSLQKTYESDEFQWRISIIKDKLETDKHCFICGFPMCEFHKD